MKKRYLLVIQIAVATLLAFAAIPDSDEWELKKKAKEVAIFVRGYPGTPHRESKAVTRMKTDLSALIAVLNDVDEYPEWIHRCGEAEILRELSSKERYIYFRLNSPWPVKDRDVVMKYSVSQDPVSKIVLIKMEDVPGYLAEKSDLVRISDLKGSWKLEPLSADSVQITYRIYVNPGGSLPAWMSNVTAVQLPFNTVVNLREFARQNKYQQAVKLEYIDEPQPLQKYPE